MKLRKTLFCASFLAFASTMSAEVLLTFQTHRIYQQDSPTTMPMLSGGLEVELRDGNFAYYTCNSNTEAPVPPTIDCPYLSRGLWVNGDADDERVPIGYYTYWKMFEVVPAILVAPSRAELCKLVAAPPSTLPRPLGLFSNRSSLVFYDVFNPNSFREYNLTKYRFNRDYVSRSVLDAEVVPGEYVFNFPYVHAPENPVALKVTHTILPEGYIVKNKVKQGVRFNNLDWGDGRAEVDPRLINEIKWEGNTLDRVIATDQQFISMTKKVSYGDFTATQWFNQGFHPVDALGNSLLTPGQQLIAELQDYPIIGPGDVSDLDFTFFPPQIPGTQLSVNPARAILPSPLTNSYILPPILDNLANIADPSDSSVGGLIPESLVGAPEVTFTLRYSRNVMTSGVTRDSSRRDFKIPIRFVNTYEGYVTVAAPSGVTDAEVAREADFNENGFSNYEEWRDGGTPFVMGASTSISGTVARVSGPTGATVTKDDSGDNGDRWAFVYPKQANLSKADQEAAPKPVVEFSTDLKNWRVVGDNDPDWVLIDDPKVSNIRAVSRVTGTPTASGYFRVRK